MYIYTKCIQYINIYRYDFSDSFSFLQFEKKKLFSILSINYEYIIFFTKIGIIFNFFK